MEKISSDNKTSTNQKEIERIIEENQFLIHYVIHNSYPNCKVKSDCYDELFQLGLIGLWKAATHFEKDKSNFATFAVACIKREIYTAMRMENRRKNKFNAISLDDIIFERDGNDVTLGDVLIGSDDVDYLDLKGFIKTLTPREKKYFNFLCNGNNKHGDTASCNQRQLAKKTQLDIMAIEGVSRQTAWKVLRKIRHKWRVYFGE